MKKKQNNFFYFDSVGDYNVSHAKQLVQNIYKHLGLEDVPPIQKVPVPQQNNGVDCGVFMLIFCDILIQHIKQGSINDMMINQRNFWPDIKVSDVLTKRAQLAYLLHNNNFAVLGPNTVAEMMFQASSSASILASPEFLSTEGSPDTLAHERETTSTSIINIQTSSMDTDININNQRCNYNTVEQNMNNLQKWNEVNKGKEKQRNNRTKGFKSSLPFL